MIDVSVARKLIFCAPISPADNQFRREIRSLEFSCFFCDARNQYEYPQFSALNKKNISHRQKLFRFLCHIISLYRVEKRQHGEKMFGHER